MILTLQSQRLHKRKVLMDMVVIHGGSSEGDREKMHFLNRVCGIFLEPTKSKCLSLALNCPTVIIFACAILYDLQLFLHMDNFTQPFS